jgi:type I site-specific restriction-modification system R (restriction) subunit
MTREELLALVNKEADTTKFKSLSQKTINEELDDVLEDFGDDEAANAKLVTKLANRLKRMDGNLHKNVSDEIKKSKEEAERKKQEEEEERKRKEADKGDDPDDKYSKLLERKYSGNGFDKVPLRQILQKERKMLRRDENSDDRGFKLLPKKIAKKYVGHSPDFFESWFYVMIFCLTKKKNKKVKGLWMLSR